MKIRSRWFLYLCCLVFGLLGTRLAWRLTTSESGWRPHLEQWVDTARQLVGSRHLALGDQDPDQQARFWLGEVSKVESVNHDPQLAMGAAWVLDAPQFGFIWRSSHRQDVRGIPDLPAGGQPKFDTQVIAARTEKFEALCRKACLARIESAVRLDQTNVELWRARALLQFEPGFASIALKPRQQDWLAVLEDCSRHDPDNAVYDYLAAVCLWASSADYDLTDSGYVLNVRNENQFRQGELRLAAGLAKPRLQFGTEGYAAVWAFLEKTSVPRSEQIAIADSRQIDNRAATLLANLTKWHSVRLDLESRKTDFAAAVVSVRNVLKIADQITTAGNSPGLLSAKLTLRRWGLSNLERLNEKHPKLLSPKEAAAISPELTAVRLEQAVLEEAQKRLKPGTDGTVRAGRVPGDAGGIPIRSLAAVVAGLSRQLLLVTVGLLVISVFVTRLPGTVADYQPVTMGWGRHLIAWVAAIGLSFLMLGVLPAWVSPAIPQKAEPLPVTAGELQTALNLENSDWKWAVLQWQFHNGAFAIPFMALALLLLWFLIRQAGTVDGGLRQMLRSRKIQCLKLAAGIAAGSCFTAALVFLLFYLGATPPVADSMDNNRRVQYERLANPAQAWEEIGKASRQIRSDARLMTRLQAEVDEQNHQRVEQEARFEE